MDITSWNENTGEPRVWKLTSAVRGRAGGKGLSHQHLACCLSYYDLHEPLPDHSSLTRIRERYGVDVFRRFFDAIVEQCQQEKLVWGKELYIDSTQVNANADLDSLTPRFAVEARAAIQAHLAALFAPEAVEIEAQEAAGNGADPSQTEAASPAVIDPAPLPLSADLSQAEHEELASENAARRDWIAGEGQQQREVHGLYQEEYLERVRTYQQTLAYQKALRKRQVWVEPLFAEAKDWHGLRRFRLRLLWRVNCEALRIATGQNLKRLLKKRGWGRRPFPVEALCASFWGLLCEVLVLILEKGWFLVPIGRVSSRLRAPCVSLC